MTDRERAALSLREAAEVALDYLTGLGAPASVGRAANSLRAALAAREEPREAKTHE